MSDTALKSLLDSVDPGVLRTADHPKMSVQEAHEKGLPALPKRKKSIPLEVILYYKVEKRLSDREIGKMLGCTERNVSARLRKAEFYVESDPAYQKARPLILRMHQRRLLEGLTDDKIRSMRGGEITKSHKDLHEAERLEEGKSTANISYADTVKMREAKEAERDELAKELGLKGVRLLPEGV